MQRRGLMMWIDDLPPLSLNNAYTTTGAHFKIKSKKTVEWLHVFETEILRKYGKDIEELRRTYDETKHVLGIQYLWLLPNLLTKEGLINKKSVDWSNMAKIPDDKISEILHIDDSQICYGSVCKAKSFDERFRLCINITIEDMKDVLASPGMSFIKAAIHGTEMENGEE